ncbi:hypothetical protein STEG23_005376 [Scotinomys teguina]
MSAQTPGICTAFGDNRSYGHGTDPGCSRSMDPDMALGCASSQDATMALGGSTWHSDLYGPSGSMTLRHQHGPRCQPRPLASVWPLVVTGPKDINSDPGCGRSQTYLDIALGSMSGPDNVMALGGSTGHPNLYGPGSGMTLRHQQALRCQPRPLASAWPLVVTGTTVINSDSSFEGAMDPNMVLSSSPGQNVIMAQVAAQATQIGVVPAVA